MYIIKGIYQPINKYITNILISEKISTIILFPTKLRNSRNKVYFSDNVYIYG